MGGRGPKKPPTKKTRGGGQKRGFQQFSLFLGFWGVGKKKQNAGVPPPKLAAGNQKKKKKSGLHQTPQPQSGGGRGE